MPLGRQNAKPMPLVHCHAVWMHLAFVQMQHIPVQHLCWQEHACGTAIRLIGRLCYCLNRKLVELERELRAASAKRHAYAEGHECCCCTCVFHSYVIPAYVRTWDL